MFSKIFSSAGRGRSRSQPPRAPSTSLPSPSRAPIPTPPTTALKNADISFLMLQKDATEETLTERVRLQVGARTVKYLTIEPDTLPDDWFDMPNAHLILPDLPKGNWNHGLVSKNPETQVPGVTVERIHLDAVESVWHETRIEIFDLTKLRNMRPTNGGRGGHLWLVTHAMFQNRPVVMKIGETPDPEVMDWIDNETRVYKRLDGTGITPRFLGHVTEHGRVIGFLVEHVDGPPLQYDNGDACKAALQRLHALGIVHGCPTRSNFLMTGGRTIKIIGFKYSDYGKFPDIKMAEYIKEDMETFENEWKSNKGAWLPS